LKARSPFFIAQYQKKAKEGRKEGRKDEWEKPSSPFLLNTNILFSLP
jgi:hypothetical protein